MNPAGGGPTAWSLTVREDAERPRNKNAPNPAHNVLRFRAFRLLAGSYRLEGKLDVEAELHHIPA